MRLNRRAWALETDTLNHVGVQRALQQPLNLALCRGPLLLLLFLRLSFEFRGFGFEDVDECVADNLALLFGIFDTLEAREEEFGCVYYGEVHAEILVEHGVDLRSLVETEDAVVDHDGVEAVDNVMSYIPRAIERRHTDHR